MFGEQVSKGSRNPVTFLFITILVLLVVVFLGQGGAPTAAGAQLESLNVIADANFVYRPALFDFDVAEYIEQQPGFLAGYSEILDEQSWTAAEIVAHIAHFYSINPQVLLALLEMHSSVLSSPQPIGIGEEVSYLMGYEDPAYVGLYAQVQWAAQELFNAFYAHRGGAQEAAIKLADGTVLTLGPAQGAGSYAILSLLGRTEATLTAWQQRVGSGPEGFKATYARLFGDPLTADPISLTAPTTIPDATLPWESGDTWYYTGGPHRYNGATDDCPRGAPRADCPGEIWSSIDIAPSERRSCSPGDEDYLANRWITAARDGTVSYSGQALVKIDHDDNWVTHYSHVSSTERAEPGGISRGEHVGHPSCEVELYGSTSSIHLHFATSYNGTFQEMNGTVLGDWTVTETTHYDGKMTCPDGRERTAISGSRSGNDITDNCQPPVDVFLLVDLSGSFYDDLPLFQSQAPDLINSLSADYPNSRFGLGNFEDYPIYPFGDLASGDKAYERDVDLTFDTASVLSAIAGLTTRFGTDVPESQLPALYQAATGAGQDLSDEGYPEASIPAGQQASFRNNVAKIILLWTDAEFHYPGDPGDIPYPGPSFDETVEAILALDPPQVAGISSGGGGMSDLQAMALATGAVAPPEGVDCDGDGDVDILEGEALVCTISSSGVGIGEAIEALVEAAVSTPLADAGGPYEGAVGWPTHFSGENSLDIDGDIVLYEWDFESDGVYDFSSTEPTATHIYEEEFVGIVTLRVTDNDGLTSTNDAEVEINLNAVYLPLVAGDN